jgi:hypothetical protein
LSLTKDVLKKYKTNNIVFNKTAFLGGFIVLILYLINFTYMIKIDEILSKKLAERNLISEEEHKEIITYRNKEIFSLHNELLSFLYLSILLFTSGIGILVYKNIDSIGHLAILGLNFVLMLICFYFGFKKSKGWDKNEILFDNPLFDYVVLLGSILATIFIGYLQFQYALFGSDYKIVSLISAVFCFIIAYYFDNKTVLSIALTALTAFVGITLTPKTLFENEIYNNLYLTFSGVILGVVIVFWNTFCEQQNLKKHFGFVFTTFALHLTGVSIISGLLSNLWFVFALLLVGFAYYFYTLSKKLMAISIFVFCLVYGYIGFNIMIFRIFENVDFSDILSLFFIVIPFYFIGSIVMFFRLVINFNKEKNDRLQ